MTTGEVPLYSSKPGVLAALLNDNGFAQQLDSLTPESPQTTPGYYLIKRIHQLVDTGNDLNYKDGGAAYLTHKGLNRDFTTLLLVTRDGFWEKAKRQQQPVGNVDRLIFRHVSSSYGQEGKHLLHPELRIVIDSSKIPNPCIVRLGISAYMPRLVDAEYDIEGYISKMGFFFDDPELLRREISLLDSAPETPYDADKDIIGTRKSGNKFLNLRVEDRKGHFLLTPYEDFGSGTNQPAQRFGNQITAYNGQPFIIRESRAATVELRNGELRFTDIQFGNRNLELEFKIPSIFPKAICDSLLSDNPELPKIAQDFDFYFSLPKLGVKLKTNS